MFNIKKFLESVNDESQFAGTKVKPAQRPGDQVRGKDRATPRKDNLHPFAGRLVGNESVVKELSKISEEQKLERKLAEEFKRFKEAAPYTGVDPIVRQRMGMQPATQDEITSYYQKNPPGVKSTSGAPWTTTDKTPVASGGEMAVKNAAIKAAGGKSATIPPASTIASVSPTDQTTTVTEPAPTASDAAGTTTAPVSAPTATANIVQPVATPPAVAPGARPPRPAVAPGVQSDRPAVAQPAKTTKTTAPWDEILKSNPDIKNPNLIHPGQKINFPDGSYTIVSKGDTLSKIAKYYKQGMYSLKENGFKSLVQRLRDLSEQENAAVNKQDPDAQVTSQTSAKQDPQAVKQQQIAQAQDKATARSTMTGLSTALGPNVDTNALSSAVNKISDGEPLSGPEATSMSALTPLIAKAAETPQSASAFRTALANAALLAKQGK